MSVVLDRPFNRSRAPQSDVPVALRPNTSVQPGYQPEVEAHGRTVVKVRRKSGTAVAVAVGKKAMLFGGVFVVTYLCSALYGNNLVDKSSRLSRDASNRAAAALQAKQEVQDRIDILTSDAMLQQWAAANSFRKADAPVQTSTRNNLVALNK